MEIFRFFEREAKAFDRRLLVLGSLGGMINIFLLFTLTAAVGNALQGQSNLWELAVAGLGIFGYWFTQGIVLRRTTVTVEGIVENVRLRIVEKIRYSDLRSIENIGRGPVYNAVSTHALVISRAATGIVSSFTAFVFVCCACLVTLYLSLTAFMILGATVAILMLIFTIHQRNAAASWAAAAGKDNEFIQAFGDFVDGFKELKMNSPKTDEFIDVSLKPSAAEAKGWRIQAGFALNNTVIMVTSSLFIVLATLVFVLPAVSPSEVSKLPRLATFVVFLFGPVSQVVGFYPFVQEAIASIREIQRVEKLLDSTYEQGLAGSAPATETMLPFDMIRCSRLAFHYEDERGQPSFSLSPLDFQIAKGELVFITGGNGSGKSTFLKVLAGLYPSAHGTITVNGVAVGRDNRQSYRHLFANVFSDFHLFDRLYGIKEFDHRRARELLELTELSHKTSIEDHRIATVSLSSGERKRLALVVSILEDKPILLLDEWAAEQDPRFRRKFYREILPGLKNEGKTVIAVTHDDDHYTVADRVLKMQFGSFVRGNKG
jgi:putative ATP-binding cassette transporter